MPLTIQQKREFIAKPQFLEKIKIALATVSETVNAESSVPFTVRQAAKRKLAAQEQLKFPYIKTDIASFLALDFNETLTEASSQATFNAAITNVYDKFAGVLTNEINPI